MYNYCTLFDSNYLTRGLAMYESLKKYSENFNLYIFAFDDRSYDLLQKLNLDFVIVISLQEFEDDILLKIKKDRTAGEYCWTCTPSIIKYSIEKYNLNSCTYLDADLYFFSDPSVLIKEMGDKSVLITSHRYTPKYDQSDTSGIYCVQFMTFKNDDKGMRVLNWWRKSCNAWCYARFEDGKFGDQKYLDDWPVRFDGVHELQNLGGGVAPWNVQQYKIYYRGNHLYAKVKKTKHEFRLIFFHFHGLKFLYNNKKVDLSPYRLEKFVVNLVYSPYIYHIVKITDYLYQKFDFLSNNNHHFSLTMRLLLSFIKRKIKRTYNVYRINKFIRS